MADFSRANNPTSCSTSVTFKMLGRNVLIGCWASKPSGKRKLESKFQYSTLLHRKQRRTASPAPVRPLPEAQLVPDSFQRWPNGPSHICQGRVHSVPIFFIVLSLSLTDHGISFVNTCSTLPKNNPSDFNFLPLSPASIINRT